MKFVLSGIFVLISSLTFAGAAQDAALYTDAIAKINDAHTKAPGKNTETDLAKGVSPAAKAALKRVLDTKAGAELSAALAKCGEAALDLALMDDFEAVREKLAAVDAEAAKKLGTAHSRPRFVVRCIGDFEKGYIENFANVCDGILKGYDDVFGFKEFSKVPGKKLRFRVHLEPEIKGPPHFAPQFPWHSEIDFPVLDAAQFSSPSPKGHFFFYGLCHELGHVIAMWGDLKNMEDKHAWAHYTGVVLVDHLMETAKDQPWMAKLRDARWKSLKLEREAPGNKVPPSTASIGGVMALLIALHDSAGPKAIGAALNQMDAQNKNRRINHVRYYTFAELQKALLAVAPEKKDGIGKAFER